MPLDGLCAGSKVPRVVVLGGGFGGLYTAVRLASLFWPQDKRPQVAKTVMFFVSVSALLLCLCLEKVFLSVRLALPPHQLHYRYVWQWDPASSRDSQQCQHHIARDGTFPSTSQMIAGCVQGFVLPRPFHTCHVAL